MKPAPLIVRGAAQHLVVDDKHVPAVRHAVPGECHRRCIRQPHAAGESPAADPHRIGPQVGRAQNRALALRQARLEEDDVRDGRERHVFERAVYSNAVCLLTCRSRGCSAAAGSLAPGIGQDQRAIPDRAEEHRPLKSRETQEWQRNALQDADRVEVHGDSDAERQAARRQIRSRSGRRLEDGRCRSARDRIHLQLRAEPAKPSRYASRAAGPSPARFTRSTNSVTGRSSLDGFLPACRAGGSSSPPRNGRPAAGMRPSPRRCARAGYRRPAPGGSRSCRRSPGPRASSVNWSGVALTSASSPSSDSTSSTSWSASSTSWPLP